MSALWEWIDVRDLILTQTAALLKITPDQLAKRVAQLVEDRKKLERDISKLRRKIASSDGNGSAAGKGADSDVINGVTFVGRLLEDTPARELKSMADEIKSSLKKAVICLAATHAGKASIVVTVTDDITEEKNAVDLVKIGSAVLAAAAVVGVLIWRKPVVPMLIRRRLR